MVVTVPSAVAAPSPADNPLTKKIEDPLIPIGYGKRELTSFEKYRLKKTIADLEKAARAELDRGNTDRAMKLWYRQLKLARAVGRDLEVKTLGQVGEIAWQENRSNDVRNIAERTIAIQSQAESENTLADSLLNRFATVYQQIRYLDRAIDIYQQIVANHKQADTDVKYEDLRQLGQLYLGIFDYQNAAKIYQQLLDKSTDKDRQMLDYKTLIDIYERSQQFDRAIQARKRLIEQYSQAQLTNLIPAIEIAIAQDYEALKQTNRAIKAYQRAVTTATTNQQLALASNAIEGIARLYLQQNKTDKAISTYIQSIDIQQQSYDYYGVMDTYDTLGQIYLESDRKDLAQQYFQRALDLAKALNYKVEYFNSRIKQI